MTSMSLTGYRAYFVTLNNCLFLCVLLRSWARRLEHVSYSTNVATWVAVRMTGRWMDSKGLNCAAILHQCFSLDVNNDILIAIYDVIREDATFTIYRIVN